MPHAETLRRIKNEAHLTKHGLYNPADEHDACGIGLVASLDGTPRRDVVEKAIGALKAVWHRGAVDADGKTGDGAGLHIQIPQDFFAEYVKSIGREPIGNIAVGMMFLPKKDLRAQEECRAVVEGEILRGGYGIYGWRQVPVVPAVIGEIASDSKPEIEQVMISNPNQKSTLETDLYIIRKRIEKRIKNKGIKDFYIPSFSANSIIYKGLFKAEQLTAFYPDLEDSRFISNFAIFHQRFSTNTAPAWALAQPFRIVAHNGEINTVKGNVNWMRSHEANLKSEIFGDRLEDIKPVILGDNLSDTACLDMCIELLVRGGRALPLAKQITIPPVWQHDETIPDAHKTFFAYCNSIMEPWDGPAAITGYDGTWAIAGMDRNGLRPLRYTVTSDGLLLVGSETGMVPVEEGVITKKGRVGPGQLVAVNLAEGKLYFDREIKDTLAAQYPYAKWAKNCVEIESLLKEKSTKSKGLSPEEFKIYQLAAGVTHEEMELILQPMVMEGKEAVGSMGDDTPLAVLSKQYRGLHHYFRQNFSQVTNPPIDSLRERRVMSLKTRFGNTGNLLAHDESHKKHLLLQSPVLLNAEFSALKNYLKDKCVVLDATFEADGDANAMGGAIERLKHEAAELVQKGKIYFIISDEDISEKRAAIPMILILGALHTMFVQMKMRKQISLIAHSAECLDVHYFAVLIGVGATAVNAYLAEYAIEERFQKGLFKGLSLEQCRKNFRKAIDEGLLKIISKMGISVISSYRGGYNFETLGLSRSLVAEFFPGIPARISGVGLMGLQKHVLALHKKAFGSSKVLPIGGFYRYRAGAETHALEATQIHMLQTAVGSDSYQLFKKYSASLREHAPVAPRDLLEFKPTAQSIAIDQVESITEIRKRFVTPAMSLGALSKEAHECLTIAMNRIGAASNSGEGGEDPARFTNSGGDNLNSTIKQIASARFGVTAEYLNSAREIQIKMAQGAKPGEGGQLPGFKVTVEIARLRHATPGVMLISPPPHHDIYSIEDLAQLIYDLKQINPTAIVSVKLVAQSGIGTIASGVAKAMADKILIAGHSGGTGASPQSSIKYTGIPWEIGLSEANQVLTMNRLRHRVKLQTDGGIKTGRDVVIAAMLGAEEFGIGTASLVAMGCIMVRQCHSNTCPVGVCTQDEELRKKFGGSPEKVINLMSFIAEEVREILASLGFAKLNDVIGRTDLLAQVNRGGADVDIDLNPMLVQADPGLHPRYCTLEGRNEVPPSLDMQMLEDAKAALEANEKTQIEYTVNNTHRTIGSRLSSYVVRHKPGGDVMIRLRGSAGQSLGAFLTKGIKIEVLGDANDYVGKGLSGGVITLRPRPQSKLVAADNTIIGNTCLYGATSGKLFAAGQAGERFAVRNSGATTVIEGCGSNACEYMTGGTAVILGAVGDNFGAGMTGGMAFIYDAKEDFQARVNADSLVILRPETDHWISVLKDLLNEHVAMTQSILAQKILESWEFELPKFWQVCPKEMVSRLQQPITLTASAPVAK